MTASHVPADSESAPEPADRRLFGFAAGVWASSLAGLWLSPARAWTVALAVATLVLAVVAWMPVLVALLRRRRARGRYEPRHLRRAAAWGVAALLLGAVCGLTSTAARTVARDAPALVSLALAQAIVRVDLVVTDDPQVLGSGPVGLTSVLVPARITGLVESGNGAGLVIDARVLVFASDPAWRGLLPSQRLTATGRLSPPRGGDLTAAVLTATGPPGLIDGPEWTQLAAGALRAGLQAACAALPAEPGGLLPGLVLGDTSHLDPALEEDFRATGLTHLVAVSGLNVR